MKPRLMWLGLSLFLSSALIAYLVSKLLGGGVEVFGIVFGVDMFGNFICMAGGVLIGHGATAKKKVVIP